MIDGPARDEDLLASEQEVARGLVRRVQAGDPRSEAEMVERYTRGLRFLLRRKTRDQSLVEDFLQDTWVIALARIRERGLDDPGRLAGYLCGIANNLVLSDIRRVGRQQTMVNSEIVDLLPDESSNPFRKVSRAEICRHVQRLMEELTQQRDRDILQRFYVEEEDKERICAELELDGVHFNRVLFRARNRFRDIVTGAERAAAQRHASSEILA